MFHRVKSEVQKTTPGVGAAVAEAPAVADTKEKAAPAEDSQDSRIIAPKASAPVAPQEQQPPKKGRNYERRQQSR
ncbi:MAG: hypothetical protein LRZ85_10100 [Alphaproteobacteria bacterium]|nr:hypothetical protein [Alphaproteobacteria bacterium]